MAVVLGLVVVLIVVAAAVAAVFALPVVASRYVRRAIRGNVPDTSRPDHARLANLVDGLTATMGVSAPEVVVVDDPAPNAVATGRDPRQATLAITAGLLEHGSRLELEAVLAQQLCLVRDRKTPDRDRAAFTGLFRRTAAPSASGQLHIDADLAAVAVTRYPPGLIDALRLAAGGQTPGGHRVLSQLWFVPTGADVAQRVQVLEELL